MFNTAARLEAAGAGDVFVSAAAERMLRGRVDLVPLDAIEVKGKAAQVQAHKVLAVRSVVARIDTPLVGRDRQLRMLEALEDAIDSRACVLVTVAPPRCGQVPPRDHVRGRGRQGGPGRPDSE